MTDWYRKENGEIDREKVIYELERDFERMPDEETQVVGTFDREAVGCALELLKAHTCEVVRCKECIEYKEWGKGKICMRLGSYYGERTPNDFCSLGIKRPLPEPPKEE